MNGKLFAMIFVFISSIFFVNAGFNEDGNVYLAKCETSENSVNARFGDFNLVPCKSLPVLKTFAKPVSVVPVIRDVQVIEKKYVPAQNIEIDFIDNGAKFADMEYCDVNCEDNIQNFAKPESVVPESMTVKLINFIKDCFYY